MCCIYFSSKTIFLIYWRFGNEKKKVYPLVQGREFITYKKKEGEKGGKEKNERKSEQRKKRISSKF